MNDEETMQLALARAHSVEGRSSPRPPVGAVIVRHGDIIGRGATFSPYGPHVEVEALTQAGTYRGMCPGSVAERRKHRTVCRDWNVIESGDGYPGKICSTVLTTK